MERLLHRAGPAVPIFGGAVKKRLLRRAGSTAAIFGLLGGPGRRAPGPEY